MLINKDTVLEMTKQELFDLEAQLEQQLKSKAVRSNDSTYAFVKRQLWDVRDALLDDSEVFAQTY